MLKFTSVTLLLFVLTACGGAKFAGDSKNDKGKIDSSGDSQDPGGDNPGTNTPGDTDGEVENPNLDGDDPDSEKPDTDKPGVDDKGGGNPGKDKPGVNDPDDNDPILCEEDPGQTQQNKDCSCVNQSGQTVSCESAAQTPVK